jgi:biopolymer transport protein ExbB
MHRLTSSGRATAGAVTAVVLLTLVLACGADEGGESPDLDAVARQALRLVGRGLDGYERTPPSDRVTWGGLVAAAGLGLGVLLERSARLRRRRVIPAEFLRRFLDRLHDGKLERGKALDFCELNPSPAARVALAAVRRWGRPVADLERAVALAHRMEADRLRRNVGTLRRIAALTPLLGLLGTLFSVGRALSAPSAAWGPALGSALSPLTAGVALAILALVAYDGLVGRVETLIGALDRLGAETVDAIALATPPEPRSGDPRLGIAGLVRTPHQVRVEPSEHATRPADPDSGFD